MRVSGFRTSAWSAASSYAGANRTSTNCSGMALPSAGHAARELAEAVEDRSEHARKALVPREPGCDGTVVRCGRRESPSRQRATRRLRDLAEIAELREKHVVVLGATHGDDVRVVLRRCAKHG